MSNLIVGTDINGFIVTEKLGHGSYGEVVRVRETASGVENVLKISVHEDSFVNEINVLRALSNHGSFPKLVSHFASINTFCLVMSDEGYSINNYMNRNEQPIFSLKNSLRLGLRMCTTINELHIHGFVHRDIHNGNVMLKPENDKLVVKLVDFGLAAKNDSIESMNSGTLNHRTWFASLNFFRGGPFSVIDDFISSLYILLEIRGESPVGDDRSKWDLEKELLHLNPYCRLSSQENHFIADLYEYFKRARNNGLDFDGAMDVFFSAVDGFDPTSDFEVSTDATGVVHIL